MLNQPRRILSLIASVLAAAFLAPASAQAVITVGDLKKVESQVQSLVDKTLPCTVCVISASGGGSGSGVTVSADGLVLTAAHVTQAAGEELFVIFPDGRKVKAKSLGANRLRDAGMVQITEPGPYPFVELGKSKDLKSNDWCVSLGHAGGFQPERTPPVRLGRVLANGRFVVTDCTIISGDSGGPLFDVKGHVIGIHSNIGESLSQNRHVPIDVFTEDWERMKKGETWGGRQQINPRQLIMGVQLSPQPNDDGVVLAGITPGSPAERAGLETGDIITRINGKKIESPADIVGVVSGKRPGDKIKLKVNRGDETKDFELRLIRAGQLMQRGRQRGRRPGGQRRRPPLEDESASDEGSAKPEQPAKDKNEKTTDAKWKLEESKPADEEKPDEKGKEKVAESSKPADDKKEEMKGRSVEELMRQTRRNGGPLELTPEERQRLRKFMEERVRDQGRQFGQGWRPPANNVPDDWFAQVIQAYEPVTAIASDSIYRVLVDGKQVALGTAVTADTLLTKASEIDKLDFEVEVEKGHRADGKVLEVFKQYDLALVQISIHSLKPIELSSDEMEMPLGTFLASVGDSQEPSAIGLISVKTRELASKGFLGVFLDKTDDGIVIRNVQRRSPAEKAGLKVNDVIVKLNKKAHEDLQNFIKAVGSHKPDEDVELLVRRGEEELEISVKLSTQSANPRSRIERMNHMGSELSDTRSGFPLALQHDCPIEPYACGGPLVNLDGEVVGINIARAGRIKSYALPAHVIQELLAKVNAKQQ
jgi:serine protease Do